jgi:lupus La protein
LRERFPRTPFIKYTRGADWGLVGFDKTLSEEDVAFVKENVKQINGKDVVWTIAEGSLHFLRMERSLKVLVIR